jgi:hypothetical protein
MSEKKSARELFFGNTLSETEVRARVDGTTVGSMSFQGEASASSGPLIVAPSIVGKNAGCRQFVSVVEMREAVGPGNYRFAADRVVMDGITSCVLEVVPGGVVVIRERPQGNQEFFIADGKIARVRPDFWVVASPTSLTQSTDREISADRLELHYVPVAAGDREQFTLVVDGQDVPNHWWVEEIVQSTDGCVVRLNNVSWQPDHNFDYTLIPSFKTLVVKLAQPVKTLVAQRRVVFYTDEE